MILNKKRYENSLFHSYTKIKFLSLMTFSVCAHAILLYCDDFIALFLGALYYLGQSYEVPFYFGAAVSVVAGVLMLPVPWLHKNEAVVIDEKEINGVAYDNNGKSCDNMESKESGESESLTVEL